MAEDVNVMTLRALVTVQGALKIITNQIRPEMSKWPDDPRRAALDHRLGLLDALPDDLLKRPETFVLHDVVRLEGPNERGRYRAYSAEGDWAEGDVEALLKRLQEWRS